MNENKLQKIFYSKGFLMFIFAAALLIRVLWLDRYPAGIQQDEAFAGYFSYALGNYGMDNFGYGFPVYFTAWGSGMNALYSYLCIPIVKIIGLNAWSIRLPQAVFAFLSLLAFYGILKRTVGEKAAVWGAFLMAINPWHIVMCRWGLDASLVPAFMLFGLYFFVLGLERRPWLLVSAVMYGLSLYCYATFWLVLPFVLLFQLGYALYSKRLTVDRYLVGFILILGILAFPLFLFLGVNFELLPEIRTRWISIPKMAFFRGGEFQATDRLTAILDFWKMFFLQEDRWIWNAVPGYGYYYMFSWPFILIGFVKACKESVQAFRKKEFYLPAVFVVQFLIVAVQAMLMEDGELNKINTIHICVLAFCAIGIFTCCQYCGKYFFAAAVLLYIISAGMFWHEYTGDYNLKISKEFQEGAIDAIEFADSLTEEKISIYYEIYYPEILFGTKISPLEAAETTIYTNYPDKFLEVASIRNFEMRIRLSERLLSDSDVVVWINTEEEKDTLTQAGYQIREFVNYIVAYR